MKENMTTSAVSSVFVSIAALLLSSLVCAAVNDQVAADPTRPLGGVALVSGGRSSEHEPIVLSSILIRSDRKTAIINGKTFHENEVIPGIGAQIKKIDADAVTLQQNNRIWRILLNKTIVRK
jgi:hypothetical protein